MYCLISACVLVAFVFNAVIADQGHETARFFQDRLSSGSKVYLPSDSNYTQEATQRWNAFSAPSYIVSVKPATEEDIQIIASLLESWLNPCTATIKATQQADIVTIRSATPLIITFLFSEPAADTAIPLLSSHLIMELKSTWGTLTPSPSTKLQAP